MLKNILVQNVSQTFMKRIKKSLSTKNTIYEFKDVNFDNVSDDFFDFAFITTDHPDIFYDVLKHSKKIKKFVCISSVEELGITKADNITEQQIFDLKIYSKQMQCAQEIYRKDNFLGFFYFKFYDSSKKDELINRMLRFEKNIEYLYDRTETIFHTKHLIDLIVEIIRETDRIYQNDLIKVNNFVNLSYTRNHKISEIADFCSSKVIFQRDNIENINFYGDGQKIKKIFTVNSFFDLAGGILSNQR